MDAVLYALDQPETKRLKPSTAAVLELLRRHQGGITPLQALHEAGTFRLPARVYELRKAGYVISKRSVGDGIWVYRLVAGPVA